MTRDWDAELKKIDKQLASISDEALRTPEPAAPASGATPVTLPGAKPAPVDTPTTGTFPVIWRLALVVALGVGMLFWPYSVRCGAGLFGYLGAVGVLIGAGLWTSIWTWRHRAAKAHVLSLLIVLWGGVLGAVEVLPRIGYAIPTEAHPTTWMCQ